MKVWNKILAAVMGVPAMVRAAWGWLHGNCWICRLPGGGHGGPVYWLQRWHLDRQDRI